MCQCGPTATGTPNTAGSSTEWSPARWYPPPTNATSARAYRSARIPTRSTTITGAEDVCSTCDNLTGRGRPTRAAACAMPARWSGLGSCGARTSRAVGTCASKSTNAGRITASSAGQVDPATMVNVLAGAMARRANGSRVRSKRSARSATLSYRVSPVTSMAAGRAPSCSRRRPSSSLIVPMRSRARYAGSAQPRAGQRSRELCGATVAEMRPSFTPRCAAARVSSGHTSSFEKTSAAGRSASSAAPTSAGRSSGR